MKKVPNLRFKEFSGEWEQTTLGKVTNGFEYGMNAAATEFDGENKYIRITDIDEITNKYLDNDVVSPSGILEDKYLVNDNDILFARTGASTGKTYLYNKEDGRLYFAGFLIRSNVNSLNNSKFIFLQTQNQEYKKWVKVTSMRSGQPGINSQEYASYSFYSPKLGEQEKIAAFFSLIDKKIELQTEKVEELKNYKKGLMQKIFSQELRFKGFSGEWESKKIGSICEIIMGQSPSSACYNEDKIGLPLIQGNADIKNRKTFPRVYTSDITKTCDVGDIIMSVRAPVGAISRSLHHACIGRGVCSIKPKQNSEFIYQFLLNYENKWSRISQGSTFESINSFDITSTNIVLPLKEEQEKIASFFSLIDKKLELEMEKLEQLQEYKKGLLQQMFI